MMSWENIGQLVLIMLAVSSAAIGLSTAYLRLFIGKQINDCTSKILDKMESDYQRKDLVDLKLENMRTEVNGLRDRVRQIEQGGNC